MRKLDPPFLWMLVVAFVALLVRLTVVLATVDIPGDGPSRAIDAYEWSRRPFVPTWGWWPPGFLFLTGALNLALPRPIIANRLLNVLLGTLTVPLSFLLVRRAFGSSVALFGAAALACLPLHLELSASSFSETSFTFEAVTGTLLFAIAFSERIRPVVLALALVCLSWASMTRYEAWFMLPVFPLFALWCSRNVPVAFLVGAVLVAFPLAWTVGNTLAVGDPLLGLTITKKGGVLEGVQPGTAFSALQSVADVSIAELGPLVAPLVLVGVLVALREGFRAVPRERVLYLAVAGSLWLPMLYIAMVRGTTLFSRYLVLGYALVLPCAALPFRTLLRDRPRFAGALLLVTVVSFGLTGRYLTPKWVTHRQPTEIQTLTAWLERNAAPDAYIVLTDMEWDASYLALYWPEVASRRAIVSAWMEDYELRFILGERRPALLVTRETDREQQARIAAFLGADLGSAPLVHEIGTTRIYDIRPLVSAARDRDRTRGITPPNPVRP